MSNALIAFGVLILFGVGWYLVKGKSGTKEKDERDPDAPRNVDRGHARSEAEAAKSEPLSPADEVEAAELVAYFEEIGTGEQFLVLAFDVDPLTAPIPEDRTVADPELFDEVTAGWLSMFTWTAPTDAVVPLSSVQISEPAPLELDGFTASWTRSQMAEILAKGKAAAR